MKKKMFGFYIFVSDVINEVGNFGSCYLASGSTARPKYFAKVFIRN